MGFGLCSLACCGSYGSGFYSAFVSSCAATLSSAPPFVCSGSYYPLSCFASRIPGCSFQFSSAFSTGCGCGCSLRFVVRLLLPCLSRIFRVWFLTVLVLRFPVLLLFLLVRTFTGFFPFSPLCFHSLFLLREVVPSIFSSFSFRSAFLDYCFYLFGPLPFFGVPPWGSWRFSSFVGVSPFRVSPLVLGPLSAWSLRVSFFQSLFRPFPLCYSSSPLCILSVFLVSALGLSFVFSCLVRFYSFIFFSFSPLGGSCPFLRDFLWFLILSLLPVVLLSSGFAGLSCCLYVFLDSASSLLSRSFRGWG